MEAESINIFADYLNPARLLGPIFDKELRVSSRRKRNYLLRSVYVVLLALYLLATWYAKVGISSTGSAIYKVSRMAEMGQTVIIGIIWFQFIVSQILAIIMLSSSISDEIRTGTLNVLMTTPVNSFQIVTGKLFSKLLQIMLLLAMSLPLLSIIRVFGGIPWNYVIYSLFIILTAVIFAGSFSLFLSVFYRHAHLVIIIETVFYFMFLVIPFVSLLFVDIAFARTVSVSTVLALTNPFWMLFLATQKMALVSMFGFVLLHCLFMLSISAVFLAISIWKIRSAALNNISVKYKKSELKRVIKDENGKEIAHYYENTDQIKRVTGNPIVWKENYKGFFGKGKIERILTILICLFSMIGISFLFVFGSAGLVLVSIAMSGMSLLLMLRLAIDTAGSIASEKEARTLPILLVTPLEDKDIILSKVKAGIRRNISIIILFFLMHFVLYFSYVSRGVLKLSQIVYQVPLGVISIAGMVLFIAGSGAYFGVRMKNSAGAIAATIGSYLGISFFIGIFNPVRLILMFGMSRLLSSPGMIQIISLASSFVSIIFLAGIGLYFLKSSIRRLRYNIFKS